MFCEIRRKEVKFFLENQRFIVVFLVILFTESDGLWPEKVYSALEISAKLFIFQHMESIRMAYYNPDHVRNYLFAENVEAKPKDFLSKFLNGKE